jgi:hypothetical protein
MQDSVQPKNLFPTQDMNPISLTEGSPKPNPDEGQTKPDPHVRDMDELRNRFPEVYESTMRALALEIYNQMKRDEKNIKKAMKGG